MVARSCAHNPTPAMNNPATPTNMLTTLARLSSISSCNGSAKNPTTPAATNPTEIDANVHASSRRLRRAGCLEGGETVTLIELPDYAQYPSEIIRTMNNL
ncbi:hypothetical protein [Nonomuraea sp. NPDC049758]|uniref:hypothetical protein n=1 Tax=Nonomuraea sp. NPDC049758 TaxID=3154360 RepID=UPI003439CDAC